MEADRLSEDDRLLIRVIEAAATHRDAVATEAAALTALTAAVREARAAGVARSHLAEAAGRSGQWVSLVAP
jgi:hypothetical protein